MTCRHHTRSFVFIISIFLLGACRQINLYEHDTAIPGNKWSQSFRVTGSFAITDTVAAYNIYIVLRHTDAYLYNNIWLNVGLKAPGDTMYMQKVDLSLGNDANGWEGTGMSDIWEVRKTLNDRPLPFRKAGEYTYSISQVMRDNPLLHIISAGLRLEKAPSAL